MKKVILKKNKEKKQMILQMEKQLDFDTIQCNIELIQKQINNEEIFKIITQQINELKNKEIINQNNLQRKDQNNEQRIKQLEEKIKMIEKERNTEKEEYKQLKEQCQQEITDIKKDLKNLMEENKKIYILIKANKKNDVDVQIKEVKHKKDKIEKEKNEILKEINSIKKEIKKINILIVNNDKYMQTLKEEQLIKSKEMKPKPFKGDPCNLKYIEDIANNNSCVGLLFNFEIFKGLKDNIEYIIYNNKSNYNIEIMRINNKTIINSLKGHYIRTTIIKKNIYHVVINY